MEMIKEFKCRASKGGDLMTNGRGKDTMGQTCITMLKDWLITQVAGKHKEIETKYFPHGNYGEPSALVRASKYFGQTFIKNETFLEDEFFTGTFDSRSEQMVIDVKSPWEAHNMPYFEDEAPKGYYNQLQIYMALTGLKKAALVYCLEDHSENDIEKLAWKLAQQEADKNSIDEVELEMCHWDEAKKVLTYNDVPDYLRIKTYEFDRDDELIEKMQKRVVECREHINTVLLPQLNELKSK